MNAVKVKSPLASKTLWFNGLSTAAALLTVAAGVVPPPAAPYLVAAQGLVNIGLRFVTSSAIR